MRSMFFGGIRFTEVLNDNIARNKVVAKDVMRAMKRFHMRDWGELCAEDKAANDADLRNGCGRVLAKYSVNGESAYIEMFIDEGKLFPPMMMYCWEY